MMQHLDNVCDMLDTYGGRDKIMKALCYSAKLLSGLEKNRNEKLSQKFATFSSAISKARATLRLVDDIPMLRCTLEYGFGSKEPDVTMSTLGVIANFVDTVFYPVDKICWLSEYRLLSVDDPGKWDTINSLFWVSSVYLNLMRNLRSFMISHEHKNCLAKFNSNNVTSDNFSALLLRQRMELITILRLTIDLVHAASTLPKGWLWGGRLETWQVGLLGTVSSFIGIYQFFAKKNSATKN